MAGEGDKTRWVGIRPTNPAENIPVDLKALVNIPIIPASPEKIFTRYEPPEGCTLVEAALTVTNASTLIYTVPASKILYLTDLLVSIVGGVVGYGGCYVRNAIDAMQYWLCIMRVLGDTSETFSHSFAIAKTIPAGWDVVLRSGAANIDSYAVITGYTRSV